MSVQASGAAAASFLAAVAKPESGGVDVQPEGLSLQGGKPLPGQVVFRPPGTSLGDSQLSGPENSSPS